jgi:hypothetical protein
LDEEELLEEDDRCLRLRSWLDSSRPIATSLVEEKLEFDEEEEDEESLLLPESESESKSAKLTLRSCLAVVDAVALDFDVRRDSPDDE